MLHHSKRNLLGFPPYAVSEAQNENRTIHCRIESFDVSSRVLTHQSHASKAHRLFGLVIWSRARRKWLTYHFSPSPKHRWRYARFSRWNVLCLQTSRVPSTTRTLRSLTQHLPPFSENSVERLYDSSTENAFAFHTARPQSSVFQEKAFSPRHTHYAFSCRAYAIAGGW